MLFEVSGYFRPGDLHPAGERFAMVRSDFARSGINVVLNWLEELKERVPVPKGPSVFPDRPLHPPETFSTGSSTKPARHLVHVEKTGHRLGPTTGRGKSRRYHRHLTFWLLLTLDCSYMYG